MKCATKRLIGVTMDKNPEVIDVQEDGTICSQCACEY